MCQTEIFASTCSVRTMILFLRQSEMDTLQLAKPANMLTCI